MVLVFDEGLVHGLGGLDGPPPGVVAPDVAHEVPTSRGDRSPPRTTTTTTTSHVHVHVHVHVDLHDVRLRYPGVPRCLGQPQLRVNADKKITIPSA
jgi:hypothetical protein